MKKIQEEKFNVGEDAYIRNITNSAFKVYTKNQESYIICGDHIASKKIYRSDKEIEKRINKIDEELTATMINLLQTIKIKENE